jgi:lysozyme
MGLSGIDVSSYQGNVNWQAVADSGITFAFVKATEGVQSSDDYFEQNWAAMAQVGIVRSAYHFFMANKDPIDQANNFLRLTQKVWRDGDLPPVLDLERTYFMSASVVLDRATQWLNVVERAIGLRPIIYTFPNFWESSLGNSQRLADYPLWIAHFQTDQPYVPGGWSTYTFHQYTESGQVKGVGGSVDRNYFDGTLDDLQKLVKGNLPLRQGAQGQIVVKLQTLLQQKGFDPGVIDGDFGPKTKAIVMTFQTAAQLLPDGIVGPRTWAALGANNVPVTPVQLTLINVCRYYQNLPQQKQSLQWLQQQLAPETLQEFLRRWRNLQAGSRPSMIGFSLVNVCKYYQRLVHQDQALTYLQGQIPAAVLEEFIRRWRQAHRSGNGAC